MTELYIISIILDLGHNLLDEVFHIFDILMLIILERDTPCLAYLVFFLIIFNHFSKLLDLHKFLLLLFLLLLNDLELFWSHERVLTLGLLGEVKLLIVLFEETLVDIKETE